MSSRPRQKPVALTDFPLYDPDIRTSDVSSFAWVSPNEILFSKDGVLWTVSPASAKTARMSGGLADAGNFTLSRAIEERSRSYARRADLDRVACEENRSDPSPGWRAGDRVESRLVYARRSVARVHVQRRRPARRIPACFAFNGDRVRAIGNSNGVVAGGADRTAPRRRVRVRRRHLVAS